MQVHEGQVGRVFALKLEKGDRLIVEGLHQHIPKGYIYFAMAFSVLVELLDLRLRKVHAAPVKLHEAYVGEARPGSAIGAD